MDELMELNRPESMTQCTEPTAEPSIVVQREMTEELKKLTRHLEAMAEQVGKKKEKRFSMPRLRLPRLYLPEWEWPTVLTVVWMLAALFLLWFSSVDGWSKLSLMLR